MPAHLTPGTWGDICLGSYYGTSALLHEIVELRILLNRDPYLPFFEPSAADIHAILLILERLRTVKRSDS